MTRTSSNSCFCADLDHPGLHKLNLTAFGGTFCHREHREKKVYQVNRVSGCGYQVAGTGYQDVDIRISEYQVAGYQGNRDPPEADKFSIREGLFK